MRNVSGSLVTSLEQRLSSEAGDIESSPEEEGFIKL